MLEVFIYVIFCVLKGLRGVHRRAGFFATSLLAFVFTPLAVLAVLFITGPSRRVEWRMREKPTSSW